MRLHGFPQSFCLTNCPNLEESALFLALITVLGTITLSTGAAACVTQSNSVSVGHRVAVNVGNSRKLGPELTACNKRK